MLRSCFRNYREISYIFSRRFQGGWGITTAWRSMMNHETSQPWPHIVSVTIDPSVRAIKFQLQNLVQVYLINRKFSCSNCMVDLTDFPLIQSFVRSKQNIGVTISGNWWSFVRFSCEKRRFSWKVAVFMESWDIASPPAHNETEGFVLN